MQGTLPSKPSFVATKLGLGQQVESNDPLTQGFSLAGFVKNANTQPDHTFALWFQSGTAAPSDTLLDFTTLCSPLAVAVCGISVTYQAPGQITVFAGSPQVSGSVKVQIPNAGMHSVVVAATNSAPGTTKQITVFVDGVTTSTQIISIGNGNVYNTVSDRIILPHAIGTIIDEIQMFPFDMTTAQDTLCENGFDGEFDPASGTCLLTSN